MSVGIARSPLEGLKLEQSGLHMHPLLRRNCQKPARGIETSRNEEEKHHERTVGIARSPLEGLKLPAHANITTIIYSVGIARSPLEGLKQEKQHKEPVQCTGSELPEARSRD